MFWKIFLQLQTWSHFGHVSLLNFGGVVANIGRAKADAERILGWCVFPLTKWESPSLESAHHICLIELQGVLKCRSYLYIRTWSITITIVKAFASDPYEICYIFKSKRHLKVGDYTLNLIFTSDDSLRQLFWLAYPSSLKQWLMKV